MTEIEKIRIRTLREAGYSYGSIAKLLKIKRSTISNHCLRHDINPTIPPYTAPLQYKVCENCNDLFVPGKRQKKTQRFCSNKCRKAYWRREHAETIAMEDNAKSHQTLNKGLDFISQKSDELGGIKESTQCPLEEIDKEE